MPTYEYKCENCGHVFEEFQSITAKPLVKCPQCEKRKLKRLIGAGAGLIFKGSGFYQTDYRSDGYKNAAKESSSSKASESKPSAEASKADKPKNEPAKTQTSQSEPAKSESSVVKANKKPA